MYATKVYLEIQYVAT